MADGLSQSEIDALLNELGAPTKQKSNTGTDYSSVRNYDFRHPSKLSKDQMRTLQMIYEAFARRATSGLSAQLRSVTSVTLVSIEQSVFDDYTRGLPATTVMNIVSAAPLPGAQILEFSIDLAFMFLDRLLGGKGRPYHREGAITEIEEELLHQVTLHLLTQLVAAWQDLLPITPSVDSVEYSPRFIQIMARNEVVILLVFDVRIFDMQATMSMCVPYAMLEPIVPNLTTQMLFAGSGSGKGNADQAGMGMRLAPVRIPLSVELGTTSLLLEDVVQLQVGDVIRLDSRVGIPLSVIINGHAKFTAQPGAVGRHLGVRVEAVHRPTEEAH